MKRIAFLFLCAAIPAIALAAIQIQPLVQQNQPQLQAQNADSQTLAVDWQKQAQELSSKNKALRAENDGLKTENADLKEQIRQLTSKGGKLVQAYCSTQTSSMNTAGESSDCGQSGYTCEPVSGLCRTSCQNSDMCSLDFRCNVEAGRCEKAF